MRRLLVLIVLMGCKQEPAPAQKLWWCHIDHGLCFYDSPLVCSRNTENIGGGCIQTRAVSCREAPAKGHGDTCFLRWDDCTEKNENGIRGKDCVRVIDLNEVN